MALFPARAGVLIPSLVLNTVAFAVSVTLATRLESMQTIGIIVILTFIGWLILLAGTIVILRRKTTFTPRLQTGIYIPVLLIWAAGFILAFVSTGELTSAENTAPLFWSYVALLVVAFVVLFVGGAIVINKESGMEALEIAELVKDVEYEKRNVGVANVLKRQEEQNVVQRQLEQQKQQNPKASIIGYEPASKRYVWSDGTTTQIVLDAPASVEKAAEVYDERQVNAIENLLDIATKSPDRTTQLIAAQKATSDAQRLLRGLKK